MGYIKTVDRESLTPEELEALDSGSKTEEDLISEWEAKEAEEREAEKKQLSDELAKAKELAENYKIRSEKAEKKGEKDTPKTELSQTDIITLAKADIHEDDIDEVLELAKFKKISVKEALSSNVMKSLLAERKEERKTAEATSAGAKRSGTRAKSGDELLSDANTGKLPDTDEGIKELADARFQSKTRK